MAEDFITVNDAAKLLGRTVSTVWRLIQKYELETFKRSMDKRTYVRRTDIERLAGGLFERRPREASAAA